MKRTKRLALFRTNEQLLAQHKNNFVLCEEFTSMTIRNYLSDLRQFALWCEATWKQG